MRFSTAWKRKDGLSQGSSRPQKFFPKSPSTALGIMRTRQENNFRESQSTIVNELMPMYTKSGIKERPEIWVARGVYNIIAKVNEIIQNVAAGVAASRYHLLQWT